MTAAPLTLMSFLLARIEEDEAEATRLATDYPDSVDDRGWYGNMDDVDVRVGVGRALAECAAKRAIVEAVSTWTHMTVEDAWYSCAATYGMDLEDANCNDANEGRGCDCGLDRRVASLLNPLAAVYADHPDYDPAWRP